MSLNSKNIADLYANANPSRVRRGQIGENGEIEWGERCADCGTPFEITSKGLERVDGDWLCVDCRRIRLKKNRTSPSSPTDDGGSTSTQDASGDDANSDSSDGGS